MSGQRSTNSATAAKSPGDTHTSKLIPSSPSRRMPRRKAASRQSAAGKKTLAHALDVGVFFEPRDVAAEAFVGGPAAEDGRHGRAPAKAAQLDDLLRLGQVLGRVQVDLYVDRLHHLQTGDGRPVVLQQKTPIERRVVLQPRQPELAEVPEVLVGIDHGQGVVGGGGRLFRRRAACRGRQRSSPQNGPRTLPEELTAVCIHCTVPANSGQYTMSGRARDAAGCRVYTRVRTRQDAASTARSTLLVPQTR